MDINSDKYAEITSERPLGGTEGPNVPHFFVGDEGFVLNRNILRLFDDLTRVLKKVCATIACAELLDTWNMLLEF